MSRTKRKDDELIRIGVDLTEEMYMKFKLCCIPQRKAMTEVLREFITEYIKIHSDKE